MAGYVVGQASEWYCPNCGTTIDRQEHAWAKQSAKAALCGTCRRRRIVDFYPTKPVWPRKR